MSTTATSATDVIGFWRDAGYQRWFVRDAAFDAQCRTRFLDAHFAASRRELDPWMAGADGALALVLLLDQIPRNVFRGSAHSYATDALARHHAAAAIDAGFDRAVDPVLRIFLYMPFEHSEDIADQQRAVALTTALGDAGYSRYAILHHDVIARFGRFPHRNAALGRSNTPEEQAWLDAGGGFG
jgi:uncharacterized protein (DUF924 family)